MTPSIRAALGTAAAAASLAMIIPASAQAATGTLNVDGTDYEDPSGCITVAEEPRDLDIVNDTDQPVYVYGRPGCQRPRVEVIEPGGGNIVFGASLRIR